ncbi:MerR family transcriptional regulator [Streptomyces sp. NPDC048290]|uniref:MerR family transcriptional regulator n=1 Tax=Streptomyces sp. NPDC048290 TaxID=3155811 RepID=UPI00344ABFE9
MTSDPTAKDVRQMRVGELARRSGTSTRTLRYYEAQGMLMSARLSNGYREYDECAIERVAQIRTLLDAGLSTRVIKVIIPCFEGAGPELTPVPSPELAGRLANELAEMDHQIASLTRSRDTIRGYLEAALPSGARPRPPATGSGSPDGHSRTARRRTGRLAPLATGRPSGH